MVLRCFVDHLQGLRIAFTLVVVNLRLDSWLKLTQTALVLPADGPVGAVVHKPDVVGLIVLFPELENQVGCKPWVGEDAVGEVDGLVLPGLELALPAGHVKRVHQSHHGGVVATVHYQGHLVFLAYEIFKILQQIGEKRRSVEICLSLFPKPRKIIFDRK